MGAGVEDSSCSGLRGGDPVARGPRSRDGADIGQDKGGVPEVTLGAQGRGSWRRGAGGGCETGDAEKGSSQGPEESKSGWKSHRFDFGHIVTTSELTVTSGVT